MKDARYILQDARESELVFKKKKLPKPNTIITSPPYYGVKNYDDYEGQIGIEENYITYLKVIKDILNQCYRISSRNATLWLILDTIRKNGVTIPLPFDLLNELKISDVNSYWELKDIIIWNKSKNIPWHLKGKFKNEFEYILFFAKNNRFVYNIDSIREIGDFKGWWKKYPERYNLNGKPPSNIWTFNSPLRGWGNGHQNHLCPIPFPLIERIIMIATNKGDVVFDPFAGSGSVLGLAKAMKREGIGLDINVGYKNLFEDEVYIGANKYWQKRQTELKKINEELKVFKINNLTLRKLKACSILLEKINRKDFKYYKFIVYITNKRSKLFTLLIVSKTVNDRKNFNLYKYLSQLQKKFGIELKIDNVSHRQLLKKYNSICQLYSYPIKTFFKYEEKLDPNYLFSKTGRDDLIYSNFKLVL